MAGLLLRGRHPGGRAGDSALRRRGRPAGSGQAGRLERHDGQTPELKVEADWAGDRRVLSTSLSADREDELVARVVRERRDVTDLYTAEQRDFLHDCAPIRINLAVLTVLPAITAVRWKSVDAAPAGLDLRAERWTVGDLDLLELSTVADVDEAPARQAALTDFVRSLALPVEQDQQAKTGQVLSLLVRLALEG